MTDVWNRWPDWTADAAGVHQQQIVQPDGRVVSVRLSHPARPFRVDVGAGLTIGSAEAYLRTQSAAEGYLGLVLGTLGFATEWQTPERIRLLAAAPGADGTCFGWLPPTGIAPGGRLTLMAGNRWLDDGQYRPLGGGVGLSLELVLTSQGNRLTAVIVGSAASLPGDACAGPVVDPGADSSIGPLMAAIGERIARSLALTGPPLITGLRLSSSGDWLAVSGLGTTTGGLPVQVEADLQSDGGGVLGPLIRSRAVLASHGTATAQRLFDGSPPGAKRVDPSGPRRELDKLRVATTRLPGSGALVGGADRWTVRPSVVAHRGPVSTLPAEPVPTYAAPLRSDALSALHAALRADELFRRLDAYALSTPPLRMVQLPLELHPRAPLRGAPDGDIVNAEVRVRLPAPAPSASMPVLVPVAVEVRFGAAAPNHREWHPGPSGRPGAQALGLAADLRWAWHEFGHVLVFAATGRLELRFAHGIGDALAALIGAPGSPLAGDPDREGLTFPWVLLGRRHDRAAARGWCWCGRRSALRRSLFGNLDQRAGYFEEQLFSSAMYRAYLSLGGADPEPSALALRRSASDYLVYLLMRAVLGLPHDALLPARSVEVLVDAMVAIDLGAVAWTCTADWPEGPPRVLSRRGGRVHKVLRWAFEQQGLAAGLAPGQVFEGPALPKVDLYIDDLAGRGGQYPPLPLGWPSATSEPAPWMATDSDMGRDGETLVVYVRNRGRKAAEAAEVKAWSAPDVAGRPGGWTKLTPVTQAPLLLATVNPGAVLPARFDLPAAAGPIWVFAAVSSPDDPANIDDNLSTGSGMPPVDADELAELVALDNNCALRRL